MAAFKNKTNGTWYVQFRYTDWKGERQQKLKRGFATKKEAQAWEREFLMQKQADVNMTFESFAQLYEKDMKPKLKLNTWLTKESIIQKKILPYFGKPLSYYAFEMLYWCGIREGELLALTPTDFDFEAGTVSISKSYQRLKGKDVITTPKTKKSNRVIKMPKFLCGEMEDYLKMFTISPQNVAILTRGKIHSDIISDAWKTPETELLAKASYLWHCSDRKEAYRICEKVLYEIEIGNPIAVLNSGNLNTELIRIAYVAMTRPRKLLVVSVPKTKTTLSRFSTALWDYQEL